MRINRVKHSLTEHVCGKCSVKIRASRDEKKRVPNKRTGKTEWKTVRILGDSYIWIKFNRGPKKIRCAQPSCTFRASDMTTSDKLARAYGAQEQAEDEISTWGGTADDPASTDDLKQALDTAAEEIREVAGEYGESADSLEQTFTGGSPTIDECREKQENLESWADELESVSFEEWDEDAEHEPSEDQTAEEAKTAAYEQWEQEQKDLAEEALGNCPV